MTDGTKGPTPEEMKEEDRRIRHLRRMVDFTMALMIQGDMGLEEAQRHTAALRDFAARLFPGKEHVFDMVYGPRLRRLLADKYNLS